MRGMPHLPTWPCMERGEEKTMTFQEYLNWLNQQRTGGDISLILLQQKHRDISKEVSVMLEARR